MQFTINRLSNKRPTALALSLALATLSLAALEATVRLKGFQPSLSDSDSLWAISRTQAQADDAGIILVGSSRFHMGIDPTQLAKETNTSVINLSLSGASVFPILHDLAKSKVTPDTILIEYIPTRWVNEHPDNIQKAKARLIYFHNHPYTSQYEVFLRTQVADRWAVLNPLLNLRGLPGQLFPGKNADHSKLRLHPDRFMETVYKDKNPAIKVRTPLYPIDQHHTDPQFWINNARPQLDDFEATVTTLQNAGTKVIVFQIPVCESQQILDRDRYGEPALFNTLKNRSNTTWLSPDQLDLPQIECTDGSHLTTQSAHTVTKALAKWLNTHP